MTTIDSAVSGPSIRRHQRSEPTSRQIDRRAADGTVLGTVDLEPEWFGLEPNPALMHQVVVAQLAAARSGTQSTKTRAEVSGGGAKPFRQKGMGRSRQGSIRAPQWVGGGIALGPKPRDYRQRTPKKMIRQALRCALSDRAALERVALIDDWAFDEPKTKRAVAALQALALDGRVLVVLAPDDVVAERSFGNLPYVQTVPLGELNTYDVLRNDWIVFTDDSLPGGVGDVSSHKPRPEPGATVAEENEAEENEEAPAAKADSAVKADTDTDTDADTDTGETETDADAAATDEVAQTTDETTADEDDDSTLGDDGTDADVPVDDDEEDSES
jgi:large subunit ribosomal protein L4